MDIDDNTVAPSSDLTKYAIIRCVIKQKKELGQVEFKANFFNLDHNTTVLQLKNLFAPKMGIAVQKITEVNF